LTDIDDILAKLSKNTNEKYRLARDISKDYIPTASIGLNMLLGGGVGIGKQTTFYGNESAGKSAFWLQSIGLNQKLGRVCAYIDAEKTFDPHWAQRLGVNTDELLVSQVSSIGDYTDVAHDFIKAGVEIIVVDSTSALMPKSFFEDDGTLKEFDRTGQIGQFARELGQSCRMLQGENFTCAMIHISQVRMDLAGFKPSMKASGGKEVGHADSLRVRLMSSKSDTTAIKGEVALGNTIVQENVGRKVKWYIEKNKMNGHFGEGEYDLYFRNQHVGIDRISEVLDYGIKYGTVRKGGAWIYIGEEKFQGQPKAVEYLRQNPDVFEKMEVELLGQSV